jgi:hypothetical protein
MATPSTVILRLDVPPLTRARHLWKAHFRSVCFENKTVFATCLHFCLLPSKFASDFCIKIWLQNRYPKISSARRRRRKGHQQKKSTGLCALRLAIGIWPTSLVTLNLPTSTASHQTRQEESHSRLKSSSNMQSRLVNCLALKYKHVLFFN